MVCRKRRTDTGLCEQALAPERLTGQLRSADPQKISVNSMSDLVHGDLPRSLISKNADFHLSCQSFTLWAQPRRCGFAYKMKLVDLDAGGVRDGMEIRAIFEPPVMPSINPGDAMLPLEPTPALRGTSGTHYFPFSQNLFKDSYNASTVPGKGSACP